MTDCSRSQDSITSPIASSTTETTTDQSSSMPDPYVNEYNYVVINEKTHVACIAANMTIFMKIPYVTKQSKVCIFFEQSLPYFLRHISFPHLFRINLDPVLDERNDFNDTGE